MNNDYSTTALLQYIITSSDTIQLFFLKDISEDCQQYQYNHNNGHQNPQ